MDSSGVVERCPCCLGRSFRFQPVLWPDLVDEWRLDEAQARYIDLQQGLACTRCGTNLRSMALARAITRGSRLPLPLWLGMRPALRILEVNAAGGLTKFFRVAPRHMHTEYPDVDMMSLPFDDASFDLVIHSDTLEHVPDPIQGLRECRRVLKRTGRLCYTVPLVVERLTERRDGRPPSYHTEVGRDLVHTEYGADAWTHPVLAGFSRCALIVTAFPSAVAIEAKR